MDFRLLTARSYLTLTVLLSGFLFDAYRETQSYWGFEDEAECGTRPLSACSHCVFPFASFETVDSMVLIKIFIGRTEERVANALSTNPSLNSSDELIFMKFRGRGTATRQSHF